MTSMITGARTGGWSFRLLGVPITVHVTYLLLIALVGFDGRGFDYLGIWVAVATAGILVHELGHALVVRLGGQVPRIDLAGLGGVTSWQPGGRAASRGWRLAVSLAGPGAGMLAAGIAVLAGAPCCAPIAGSTLGAHAAATWVFVTLWWSLLNLVPVLPLDGGQALESALPGTPEQRRVRALAVSIVTGVGMVILALQQHFTFAAFLVAWLTWGNVRAWQSLRTLATPVMDHLRAMQEAGHRGDEAGAMEHATAAISANGPREARRAAAEAVLRARLQMGDVGPALLLLDGPAAELDVDPRLIAEVVVRAGDRAAAMDRVTRMAAGGSRHGRAVALLLARWLGDLGRAVDVAGAGPIDPGIVTEVMESLVADGQHRPAAAIGDAVLREGTGEPRIAYLSAVALAQSGDIDAAAEHLAGALRLGFDDVELLRTDPLLRPLHGHADWAALAVGHAPRRR